MKRIQQILCGSLLSILVCIFAQQLDAKQAPTTPTSGLPAQTAEPTQTAPATQTDTNMASPAQNTSAQPSTAATTTQAPIANTKTDVTSVATVTPTNQPVQNAPTPDQTTTAQTAPIAPNSMPSQPAATSQQGITIKNPTQYPATISLHITPSNQVIQKDVAPGQTVALFDQALNKTDTYTASGSLFRTVITKTTVTTISGAPQAPAPAEFITTKTNRLSSSKNWSSNASSAQKIDLTIKLVEIPGAEPIFEIQQE